MEDIKLRFIEITNVLNFIIKLSVWHEICWICSNFSILVKHIFSILELWLCDKAEALFFGGNVNGEGCEG